MNTKTTLAAVALLTLAACGGGGLSSTPTGAQTSNTPGSRPTGSLTFTITIPSASSSSSTSRRPFYVSPNTQSVVIQQLDTTSAHAPVGSPQIVNVTSTSNGCTTNASGTTCTITYPAAAGTFDFSVKTYDATNGGGHLLSENTLTTFTVIAAQANTINVTLNGVLASVSAPATLSETLLAPQTLNFTPQDASGAAIIGAAPYDNGPLTVSATGGTTFSPASFAAPGTATVVQCQHVGSYAITFADQSGTIGSTSLQCSGQPISVSPGYLSFVAVALNSTDGTYDQVLTTSDSGPGPVTYQWHSSCTPGPGEAPSTQVLSIVSPTAASTPVRPLNPGTCSVYVSDNFGQQSQTISAEVHTTSISISSRSHR